MLAAVLFRGSTRNNPGLGIMWDVVRVITRLIGCLAAALGRRRIKGFRNRTRSARRRMQEIQRMTARQRQEHQAGTY